MQGLEYLAKHNLTFIEGLHPNSGWMPVFVYACEYQARAAFNLLCKVDDRNPPYLRRNFLRFRLKTFNGEYIDDINKKEIILEPQISGGIPKNIKSIYVRETRFNK